MPILYYVSFRVTVLDAMCVSAWDIGSVEAPIAAHVQFVPFHSDADLPRYGGKTKWRLLHVKRENHRNLLFNIDGLKTFAIG